MMRLFAVVLALAVAAWTPAIAAQQLHKRPANISDDGCPAYRHRGVSGACVLNPDKGPYKPDPYWMPCDYSSSAYPEGCGGP